MKKINEMYKFLMGEEVTFDLGNLKGEGWIIGRGSKDFVAYAVRVEINSTRYHTVVVEEEFISKKDK